MTASGARRRDFLGCAALAIAGGACPLSSRADALQDLRDWAGLDPEVRQGCEAFLSAYPGVIGRFFPGDQGSLFGQLNQGDRILVEDFALRKSFEERLEAPDLLDLLADPYPAGLGLASWPVNLDPGRYRHDAFFKAVYGACEDEVRASLEPVPFCGHRVLFNRRNGAAEALRRAGVKVAALVAGNPGLEPYLEKLGGGFTWRRVAGTRRLSGHSFGIAIDLNPDLGGYWRWEAKADLSSMCRRRAYPAAIVQAFEDEKFIWGGKWYHFDLMHFEFRPEFFQASPPVGTGRFEP